MKPDKRLAEIEEACRSFNRKRATDLALALAGDIRRSRRPFPEHYSIKTLKALIGKRFFEAVLALADAVFESGQRTDHIRLMYAQSLIDSGRIEAAIPYLERFLPETTARSHWQNEVRGLIGRAHKQLYVNGGGEAGQRKERILRAFNAYYDIYLENNELRWQGINAVALAARADRDKLSLGVPRPDAQRIFDEAKAKNDVWSRAIAGEAALAMNNFPLALEWYGNYAASQEPWADAFEFGSSLRQLVEVWQLTDDKSPGSELLPLLRAALLKKEGGRIELKPHRVNAEKSNVTELERVFGNDAALPLAWYKLGLKRSDSVCSVLTESGRVWGTGFVVRGADFGLCDELLILTNDHVVSDTSPDALRPNKAYVRFEGLPGLGSMKAVKCVKGDASVDASFLQIEALNGVEPIPCDAQTLDLTYTEKAYVIGHPHGGTLSFSLQDNLMVAHDTTRVHYRAPTEHGSSGSPVFDDDWNLIALHHGGSDRMLSLDGSGDIYEANEGFRVDHIRSICRG